MRMEQMVGLAVRLFALFLAIYVLRYASAFPVYLSDASPYKISPVFLGVMVLCPLLIALLLWMFPLTIAGKLIPGIKSKSPRKKWDRDEIQTIGFTFLGLWVLANAVPDTFYWSIILYSIANPGTHRMELTPDQIGYMVATVIELIIGFWLLLGQKGIVGTLRRLRYAGSH